MPDIPRDKAFGGSLDLLRDGYRFISERCDRHGTDIFRTRILGWETICVRGESAARMFYGGDRFTRVGAMPITTQTLLQDRGSVQAHDGAAHRHRKRLFTAIARPDADAAGAGLRDRAVRRNAAPARSRRESRPTARPRTILTEAACNWAGVPLKAGELAQRTYEISEMIERAGSAGPLNWRAQLLRLSCERWLRGIIRGVRDGTILAPAGSPAVAIAGHHEPDGTRLVINHAAVELLNVLRPTVAVARFIVFAALAMHERPELRDRLLSGDDAFAESFAQEVRRHAPFFALIGGRARADFEWEGYRIGKGAWVLLDLFGTNRDSRLWPEPEAFRADRFLDREPGEFDLVPQGAGNAEVTHRCPGERITLELIKRAARHLAAMRYDVPPQDLSVDLTRIPAIPRSGFLMRNVHA